METIKPGTPLDRLLEWCESQSATDLHARAGGLYAMRVHGELVRVPADRFPAPSHAQILDLLRATFPAEICARIEDSREFDFSCYRRSNRYRVNFSKQRGEQSFSFRIVPQQTLKLADLQLPDSLAELVREPRGLILVTGPTGQGKSTTARALIQEINETRPLRIVTIEDPIEYVFEDALSQFEQREVGIDTGSFADGIRNAMRQDPNVLFIGEIRDAESIRAALRAAETGHLVVTTLHADSVGQGIARLREYHPAAEQQNVSSLLARNINSVVCQRLLPNRSGTRTPCLELLKRDAGVAEAIQNNQLQMLSGIMETSVNQGMHTFDQYLMELLAARIISEDTARHYATNRHRLDMTLRGIGTATSILQPDPGR